MTNSTFTVELQYGILAFHGHICPCELNWLHKCIYKVTCHEKCQAIPDTVNY